VPPAPRIPPWACVGDEFATGRRVVRGVEFIAAFALTGDGRNVYVGKDRARLLRSWHADATASCSSCEDKQAV
jgi:hypothetical protein